jgi:glycosyltransferase involved in cell wall biosynthesis
VRVLLVTKGLDLGGIERIVTDLAVGLAAAGVDVHVALVNSARDRLTHVIEDAGITVHRLDGSDMIGIDAARRLIRLAADPAYDVVHVHGPLPSALVRLAARGKRTVTTSHTPWRSLRPLTRLAWRATARLDTTTIAVSSAVAESLPRHIAQRAVVLPHGIDPERIDAALRVAGCTDRAEASPADNRDVVVVTVASHRDAKNYPNLLRGVREARRAGAPIRLITIGEGPNLDAHIELARTLGLADVVSFEPTTDDVLAEIARADILAVASDYEGQPIVVAEALALGLPVVATAVGRVPEMVTTSVGRVVPPRDPGALGAALAELATSPELLAEMSVNARKELHAWTLHDVVTAHISLYSEVASDRA